jgi:hypothetical protein
MTKKDQDAMLDIRECCLRPKTVDTEVESQLVLPSMHAREIQAYNDTRICDTSTYDAEQEHKSDSEVMRQAVGRLSES